MKANTLLVVTLFSVTLAALLGAADAIVAQPPAFKTTNQTAKQLAANLQTPVETADFQLSGTLKGALVQLHETLAKKGKAVAFKVDDAAFKKENPDAPDVYESSVTLKAKDKNASRSQGAGRDLGTSAHRQRGLRRPRRLHRNHDEATGRQGGERVTCRRSAPRVR